MKFIMLKKMIVLSFILVAIGCSKKEEKSNGENDIVPDATNSESIEGANDVDEKESKSITMDLLLIESDKIKIYSKDVWQSIYFSQRSSHSQSNPLSVDDAAAQILDFAINAIYVYEKVKADEKFCNGPMKLLRRFYTAINESERIERKINEYVLNEITEEEYNQRMPKRFEKIALRQVILLNKEDADDVLKKALSGEDFNALVKLYSKGPTAQLRNGKTDLYFYGEGGLFSKVEDENEAFILDIGAISQKVVESPLGYMIYKVEDKIKLNEKEIEECRQLVRGNALALKRRKYLVKINNEEYKDKIKINISELYDAIKADMNDENVSDVVIAQMIDVPITYYDLNLAKTMIRRQEFLNNDILVNYDEAIRRLNVILDLLKQEDYFLKDLRIDKEYLWDDDPIVKDSVATYALKYLLKDVQASDKEIRKYYDEHSDELTSKVIVDLEIIYTKNMQDALEVLRRYNKGESFGALANELSIDAKTRKNNGFVGRLMKGEKSIPENIEPHMFKLNTGEVSQPIEVENGEYVILRAKELFPPQLLPYEKVVNYLRRQIEAEKISIARNKLFEDLKGDDKIIWHNENITKMLNEIKEKIKKKTNNVRY